VVFWIVTLCDLVGSYQPFEGTSATRPHGVRSQKTTVDRSFIAVVMVIAFRRLKRAGHGKILNTILVVKPQITRKFWGRRGC
jgi:hypothetical protein